MDIRQTAAVLGISEASVKVRLHRARALLQRHLAPQLKGYAPKRKGWFGWTRMRIDRKHVWEHISAHIDGEVDAVFARLRSIAILKPARSARRCSIPRAMWSSLWRTIASLNCPPVSANGCMRASTGNWKHQAVEAFQIQVQFRVILQGGGGPVRCTMGCVHVSRPTRIRVMIARATCRRSDRFSFDVSSRRRHWADGRLRRWRIHARTARLTRAPTVATISMGMRMASWCQPSAGA